MPFEPDRFAAKLRGKRAEADMTQAELAKRSGVSQAAICQYEDAGYMPGADKLWSLAEALGCSPNDLLDW